MTYAIAALIGGLVSYLLAPIVMNLAKSRNIVDEPGEGRKKHKKPVPLLGGIAIYAAVFIGIAVFWLRGDFTSPLFSAQSLYGLLIGGAVLMIGGYLDDRHKLRPLQQIGFPVLAALIAVWSGIHIAHVRIPFGDGIIQLALGHFAVPFGDLYWPGSPLTFFWLLGLMYTTKFLDGLDGLVSGLTVIAASIMFFVALRPEVWQPETALLSAIIAGAFLGFLVWNFSPARIFLGEGGSLFAGFVIGILAVISGSKVATTLLIFGIPILDTAWVIVERVSQKRSPAKGDRRHLHFRLIDAGLSERSVVLLLYAIAGTFGLIGFFGETHTKVIAFAVLIILMILLAVSMLNIVRKKQSI